MSDVDESPGKRPADVGPTRVTVRVYGEEYPLKSSGADAAHLQRLAEYVDTAMRQISSQGARLGTNRIAVLAAMQITDELFKLRQEYESLTSIFEDEWAKRKRKD